jgi:hypothetical protein
MVEVKGKLTCLAGDMILSTICQQRLLEVFPNQNNRPYQVELGYDLLRWFCPACGIPVKDYVCPECKKSMLPLRYMLVEFHPHKGETDALKKWKKQELEKSFNTSKRSMAGHLVFLFIAITAIFVVWVSWSPDWWVYVIILFAGLFGFIGDLINICYCKKNKSLGKYK